jgi:hypothetical protein
MQTYSLNPLLSLVPAPLVCECPFRRIYGSINIVYPLKANYALEPSSNAGS